MAEGRGASSFSLDVSTRYLCERYAKATGQPFICSGWMCKIERELDNMSSTDYLTLHREKGERTIERFIDNHASKNVMA